MRSRIIAAASVSVLISLLVTPGSAAMPIGRRRSCGVAWTVAPQPGAPSGTTEFAAVSASSVTDAWAVGYAFRGMTSTFARHFDGTSWSDVATVNGPGSVGSSLSGVEANASDDAWAVGASVRPNNVVKTLIEHWDGSAWTRVQSPNAGQPAGGYLSGVGAVAADDVWAVGSFGQDAPSRTLIEHWDGSAWSIVPSPNKGPFPNALSSVTVVASDDVWAVGSWFTKAFVDQTLVLHWDGATWTRIASPSVGKGANDLVSVDALSADDVWAVGSRGLHTLTEHWDGTAWSVSKSPTPGGNADLAGVVAVAADDVWAVGGRLDPGARALRTLVERWDGARWRVIESANKGLSDNHLWGVAASPGRMFAVGSFFRGGGNGPPGPLVLERCDP